MIRREYEKSLKRFLKRKISYSFALLISFLITGEITAGAGIGDTAEISGNKISEITKAGKSDFALLLKDIRAEKKLIAAKIKENEKRIRELEKETTSLIKEGDYYAKTLDKSRQFFFPLTYEHHHGSGDSKNISGNNEEEKPPVDEVIPPIIDVPNIEYPELAYPNIEAETPNIDVKPIVPEDIGENVDISDMKPEPPEIEIEVKFNNDQDIVINLPEIDENISVGTVTGPEATDIQAITPEGIPAGSAGMYIPRFLKSPEKIADIEMGVPDTPVSKGLEIGGTGYNVTTYYKEGTGITPSEAPTMFQNILSINTNEATFEINIKSSENNTTSATFGNLTDTVDIISQKGNFLNDKNEQISFSDIQLDDAGLKTINVNNRANTDTGFALILDAVAKDVTVSGNFDINYSGDASKKKLFMLTSGVGIRNIEIAGKEKLDELTNAILIDGTQSDKTIIDTEKAKTHIKINEIQSGSTINLYNTNTYEGINSENFLVGVEHQTFDENFINERRGTNDKYLDAGKGNPFFKDWNAFENFEYYDKNFRDSYTVFLNNGTLNLNGGNDESQKEKNKDGKNVFGVIITHEYGAPEKILKNVGKENGKDDEWKWIDPKNDHNNITANGGEINVNGSSSVGMSFETYIHDKSGKSNNFVMRDDAYVGKINVGGDFAEEGKERQGNYGFRMTNVLTKSTRLPLSNGQEKEIAGSSAAGIAYNRFLEKYWGKDVTNEEIVYMLAKWNDYDDKEDDFFSYIIGDVANNAPDDTKVEIKQEHNGENNKYFSDKMGVKPIQTTEIEVTNRIINEYDKYYDKVNVYGGGIINIDNAFADEENIAGQFKNEGVTLTEEEIEAERKKGIYRNKYGQVEKIVGLKIDRDVDEQGNITSEGINITGANNVGVVIEKSLSSHAEKYDKADDGELNGSVNGIANVHGFNIAVGGKYNVGFLRGALSSSNNKNDYVIEDDSAVKEEFISLEKELMTAFDKFNQATKELKEKYGENVNFLENEDTKEIYTKELGELEEKYNKYKELLNQTSAINTIKFAEGAENSSLIRSDRYGITLEKDLQDINYEPVVNADGKTVKNIVLHASTAYSEDRDREVETGIRLKNIVKDENGKEILASQVTFDQTRGWKNIKQFLKTQVENGTLKDIIIVEDTQDNKGQKITCKMSENFWKTYDKTGKASTSEENSVLGMGEEKFNRNDTFDLKEFNDIIKVKRENIAELEEAKKNEKNEESIKQIDNAIAQIKNDILYLDLYYKEGKGNGDTETLFAQVVNAHQNGYYDGNNYIPNGNEKYINTGGTMTNKAVLESKTAGLIGMMANGTVFKDKDGATEEIKEGVEFDDSFESASKIYNHGQIKLSGNESMGMAVMGFNYGFFGREENIPGIKYENPEETQIKEGERPSIEVRYEFENNESHDTAHSENEGKYSIGIYNEGTFAANDGIITATGAHTIGVYNKVSSVTANGKDENGKDISLEKDSPANMILNNLEILLNNGAIGIYSNGGTITAGKASSTLADNEENREYTGVNIRTDNTGEGAENFKDTASSVGVYASSDVGQSTNITLHDSNIHIENGGSAVASVGEGSTVTLNNSNIYYSGNGYALFTDKNDGENSLGKIHIGAGSVLELAENAVGLKWDTLTNNEQSVIIDKDAKIMVGGESALLHLLTETNAQYNIDSLLGDINGQINNSLNGIDIEYKGRGKTAIVDGGKLAIDKSISQRTPQYEDDTVSEEQKVMTDDFFFFKRFLGQRLQVTVGADNKEVKIDSTLSGKDANYWYDGQVVGLEMSSSSSAKGREETSITLKDKATVVANRLDKENETDKVPNTIGLYINYGEVNLEKGSNVTVEKTEEGTADETFDNGVGVFAVNGSKVAIGTEKEGGTTKDEKQALIDVYGDKAVGVYAVTFREEADKDGNIISTEGKNGENEFGKTGNRIEIENAGTIDVSHGDGGVGIFADNNSKTLSKYFTVNNGAVEKLNSLEGLSYVDNSGTIKVGGAVSKTAASVGIFGINTQIKNTGTIEVGRNEGAVIDETNSNVGGIGIYAVDGSVVTETGTIKLGDYSTGIVVDSTSTIKLNGSSEVKFSSLYEKDKESEKATERLGIFYDGNKEPDDSAENQLTKIETQVIDFDIDGTEVDKLKAVTGRNVNIVLETGKTISINENSSRGIRIDGGNITNKGTINIGEEQSTTETADNTEDINSGSIGIAAIGKGTEIDNSNGTINVNSTNGIGIYLDNRENTDADRNRITHAGTINLRGEGSVGILLKNDTDEVIDVSHENLKSINFDGEEKGKIAVYADGQNIVLKNDNIDNDEIKGELNNKAQNILLYANAGTVIKNQSDFIISGKSNEETDNKSIGVYLAGGSDYAEENKFTVKGGAIGIYSNTQKAGKDESQGKINSIKNLNMNVEADKDTTVGVMIDGRSKGTASETIGQRISGKINVTGDYGIGMYVDTAEIKIGTDTVKDLTVNLDDGMNMGIYVSNGGSLTEETAGNKIILSKDNIADGTVKDNDSPKNDLTLGIYYTGKESTNGVDIELTSDGIIGITAAEGVVLTNNKNITSINNSVTDERTIGAYASENSSYTQGAGKITLGKGGVGIYSTGKAVLGANAEITVTGSEKADENLTEVGMYAKGNGSIENQGTITVSGDKSIGMLISGENTEKGSDGKIIITDLTNSGTVKVSGESATGVYVKDGHRFKGAGGTIAVNAETTNPGTNSVAVGILLDNGAKLEDAGDIYIQGTQEGTEEEPKTVTNVAAVYARDTDVAADIILDLDKKGENKLTGYNNEGIALVAETNQKNSITIGSGKDSEYMEIAIGKNSIGAYIQDTGVKVNGLKVTINENAEKSTGIFLKNYEVTNTELTHDAYDITNVDISLNKGTGIVLSATDKNSHVDLNLGNSNITVGKVSAQTTDENADTEEEKIISAVGIYSEKGNVRLTGGNEFNVNGGIGIYVGDTGRVFIGEKSTDINAPEYDETKQDIITLSGNSIGVYAGKGGTITLGKNAVFKYDENAKVKGNYAYIVDGTIVNNMTGTLEVKDSYGIIGKYSGDITAGITNNQTINVVGGINQERAIGIAVVAGDDKTGDITNKTITNTGKITVDTATNQEAVKSIGIYSEVADINNSGKIELAHNSSGIYYNGFYQKDGVEHSNLESTGVHTIKTGDIDITGSDNKAVVLRGYFKDVVVGDITDTTKRGTGNTGLIIRDIPKITGGDSQTTGDTASLGKITLGNIALGKGSTGIFIDNAEEGAVHFESAVENGKTKGNITVGDSVFKDDGSIEQRSVGILLNNSHVSLAGLNSVNVGKGGIGVYAKSGSVGFNFNQSALINVGAGGIYIYGDTGAEIDISNIPENNNWEIKNYTGIVLKDGSTINIADGQKLNINVSAGGTGIVAFNTSPTNISSAIDMTVSDGTADKYSVGFVYKNITGDTPISLIDPTQKGSHTIGNLLENTSAVIKKSKAESQRAAIVVDEDADNSVGLMAKENSAIRVEGSIAVQGNGNIGMALENSIAEVIKGETDKNGAVIVGHSTGGKANVGIYLQADRKLSNIIPKENSVFDTRENYSFVVGTKNGMTVDNPGMTMSVQKGSVGIIGTDYYDIGYFGNINVYNESIGIASQSISIDDGSEIVFGGNLVITGKDELEILENTAKNSIGISGKNTHIKLGYEDISANITVNGDKNFGVVSEDRGNIDFNGNLTVTGENGIGIYKLGGQNGDKINLSGKMDIGEKGFGVIVSAKEKEDGKGYEQSSVEVINNADITLGTGAVGINSIGQNSVTNNGEITVGDTIRTDDGTRNRFSAGIYAVNTDWNKISTVINNGVINAVNDGSLGAVALGNVEFTNNSIINVDNLGAGAVSSLGGRVYNSEQGTINVKGGGAGVQAIGKSTTTGKEALAYNFGTINVGQNDESENAKYNVGMEAVDGGKIINGNGGAINVYKGIGMYIDEHSVFENKGTVTVYDGVGIAGAGIIENKKGGTIVVKGGESIVSGVERSEAYDTITVSDDEITLRENYHALGGRVDAGDRNLNLDGITLDATKFNGDTPAFSAKDIKGKLNISTNIILDRAETDFTIDGLFDALDGIGDITANMSFLYDIDIDDKLGMNFSKIDYTEFADSIKDTERNGAFDSIRKGLAGIKPDLAALQKLDYEISNIGNPDAARDALDKYLGEMSGDVYNSTQRRMQDIQRAFENSFDEMETSYNFSKDTEKFSLIRTEGDYKYAKDGFIDYDYDITGLLFMQEYEGTEYGNKWGYSGGFAVSKFKFDDTESSEDEVYSLKAGVHNVKNFGNDLELLTKFEAGYNRHDTERKSQFTGKNSADINSYQLNFNNILRKKLYNDIESDFGVYAALDLEYGRIHGFEEKGVLPVKVETNDYMSTRAEAGLNGTKRIYLDNDWTMKLTGKAAYSYNFGDNYDGNERSIRGEKLPVEVEEKEEGSFDVRAGVGFERLNYMGVTLEGQWLRDQHKDEDNWSVALRFNYKFGKVNPTEPKKILNLKADNYFDFDKSVLKPKGAEIIKKLAEVMNTKKIKGTLTIEGHTDWTGTEEYNQKLSERRAEAIKTELEKHLKNPDIVIVTKGYGELYPIDTNSTKEGRAANRRVEMHFREMDNRPKPISNK